MQRTGIFGALALVSGLAACGETITDQALIGSAAGLGTAVVLNGNPLVGVAAGAAANMLYCQQSNQKCN